MSKKSEWLEDSIDALNQASSSTKSFFMSVFRVIRWVPIIWKDHDWDESYLIRIMQFKLQQMAELHMKHGMTVDRFKTAEEILHAIHLLEITKMEDLDPGFDLVKEAELQAERREQALNYIAKNMSNWWD